MKEIVAAIFILASYPAYSASFGSDPVLKLDLSTKDSPTIKISCLEFSKATIYLSQEITGGPDDILTVGAYIKAPSEKVTSKELCQKAKMNIFVRRQNGLEYMGFEFPYLFVTESTVQNIGDVQIYDIISKTKKTSVSGANFGVKGDTLTYFDCGEVISTEAEKALHKECSSIPESLGCSICEKVSLNLKNLTRKQLGEKRAESVQ